MLPVTFRYEDDDCDGLLIVCADTGECRAGSVAIREHSSRQVSIGRLQVRPPWRGQGVARQLMVHVLGLFPRAEKLLFAEPYIPEPGWPEGPGAEVLESFYASLGFEVMTVPELGRRVMVHERG